MNDQCEHRFPLPSWMGEDQDEPCRCDLGVGHTIPHSCSHLRGEKTTSANPEATTTPENVETST